MEQLEGERLMSELEEVNANLRDIKRYLLQLIKLKMEEKKHD